MLLRSAALTDTGKVRFRNEDRFLCDDRRGLYAVADGIGGLPGGAEAAQQAIDALTAAAAAGTYPAGPEWDWAALVGDINTQVVELGRRHSAVTGIGTTLVVTRFLPGTLQLVHVGDSRCYAWRERQFELLTSDHNWENEFKLRRAAGERVFLTDANRNALTRCIGQPETPVADLHLRPLAAGDRYLLCTDGVTRLVRDSEIAAIIGAEAVPADCLQRLVSLANQRGGLDNATGVLIFVDAID